MSLIAKSDWRENQYGQKVLHIHNISIAIFGWIFQHEVQHQLNWKDGKFLYRRCSIPKPINVKWSIRECCIIDHSNSLVHIDQWYTWLIIPQPTSGALSVSTTVRCSIQPNPRPVAMFVATIDTKDYKYLLSHRGPTARRHVDERSPRTMEQGLTRDICWWGTVWSSSTVSLLNVDLQVNSIGSLCRTGPDCRSSSYQCRLTVSYWTLLLTFQWPV